MYHLSFCQIVPLEAWISIFFFWYFVHINQEILVLLIATFLQPSPSPVSIGEYLRKEVLHILHILKISLALIFTRSFLNTTHHIFESQEEQNFNSAQKESPTTSKTFNSTIETFSHVACVKNNFMSICACMCSYANYTFFGETPFISMTI